MGSRVYFLLLTGLFGSNAVFTQNDNLKFSVISTTEPAQHQNEHNQFEQQIRSALIETKLRFETLDLKMNLIQKTLDDLVKLHDKHQEAPTISKIEEVIEEKLEDVKKQAEEIEKRNKERAELHEANLQKVQKDIVAAVSIEIGTLKTEIKLFDVKLNATTSQLVETTKQIVENFEKSLQATEVITIETPTDIPKSCKEVQERGNKVTGVYKIQPETAPQAFAVLCNMETRGGGWTYVLNRFDGSQEFYLNWADYKQGFGNLSGEFWLGLEHLHEMTGTHSSQLLVELADWEGKTVYAHYTNFSIGSEEENYLLKVLQGYSGDAGDSFTSLIGSSFSTPDHPNPSSGTCVTIYHGSWWHKSNNWCFHVKLTGHYRQNQIPYFADGIHWNAFHDLYYSLKEARMMIQ